MNKFYIPSIDMSFNSLRFRGEIYQDVNVGYNKQPYYTHPISNPPIYKHCT